MFLLNSWISLGLINFILSPLFAKNKLIGDTLIRDKFEYWSALKQRKMLFKNQEQFTLWFRSDVTSLGSRVRSKLQTTKVMKTSFSTSETWLSTTFINLKKNFT